MFQTFSRRLFATKVATARVTAVSSTSKFPVGMKISPYAMYIKENFKKDNNTKNTEVMKDLSVKWKEMSITDKKKYSDLSQEHNEKKMNDFLKLSSEEQTNLINMAKEKKDEKASRRHTKERREKKKQEGRPAVPPNAYALFIKEKLSGSGLERKDKMKEAVAQWKSFSVEQKKKYTDEAKKLNDEYFFNLHKWESEKKENTSH